VEGWPPIIGENKRKSMQRPSAPLVLVLRKADGVVHVAKEAVKKAANLQSSWKPKERKNPGEREDLHWGFLKLQSPLIDARKYKNIGDISSPPPPYMSDVK